MLRTHNVIGFEDLGELVLGASTEIVQIGRGKLHGKINQASIGDLSISAGTFSLGVRSRGVLNRDRITVGMLTAAHDRVVRSTYEMHTGDVLLTPPGGEHEGRYDGGASVFVISLSPAGIESIFGAESSLVEPKAWGRNLYKGNAEIRSYIIPRLRMLLEALGRCDRPLTEPAVEYWKRSIVEAMTTNVLRGMPSEPDGPLPSALRLVRKVEEFLDANQPRPIHISEICTRLRVSRRTLHRAFRETTGVGPVSLLRTRRLCAIHTALRSEHKDQITVSEVAIQHGFLNTGRFADYYRRLFGEYPLETLRAKGPGIDQRQSSVRQRSI